ncbi:MAG: prenyltransferase/squalene oxidase repeat-containing protein, partial [Thermoproteota archaeon]
YRLNITEHLKDGENLLAICIKNNAGEAYFDCEIPVDYKSLGERVEEFVKDRQNIDGSFYEEYYYDYPVVTIFYATSILKTLGRMDLVEKEKIMEYIMHCRTIDGDFRGGTYFAVEALKSIGISLPSFDAKYLARKVLQRYWTESHREYDFSYTYYTLKTLESLNALSEIGNASSIIKTILSLQCSSGLFLNLMYGNAPDMITTFYALSSLDVLNVLGLINKTKVAESIIADYNWKKEFHYNCSGPYDFIEFFGSVKSLKLLDSLGRIDADEIAQSAISYRDKAFLPDHCQPYNDRYHYQFHVFFNHCQSYNEGVYCYHGLYPCPFYIVNPLEKEYYLVEILRALDKLYMVNVTALDCIINNYNLVDGGFKSGGALASTECAVRILNNLAKLNIIDKERLIQYVLPTQSLTICDEDNVFCDISEIYSPVYILTTIGASEKINRSRLISKLANHQNSDGGFAYYENKGTFKFDSSLSATYYAVEILNMINMLGSFDVEKIKNYILSLKNPDGDFCRGVKDTAMAVITLILLGEKDEIEEKTV